MVVEDFQNSIHIVLKKLIEEKSNRDQVKFTGCKLAQVLGIPRSIITKLTHTDITKRVTNPKIDTLIKIVDFFKADGFDITVDDLFGSTTKSISIKNQHLIFQNHTITLPVYSLNNKEKLGVTDLKISNKYKDVFALYSDKDILPFFKAGSIFIIDPYAVAENDNLIAVKLAHFGHIQIKTYCSYNNKVLLKSLDEKEKDIVLLPTTQVKVLGVIVQVNANT